MCAVVTGGNIDMNIVAMVIERGLIDTGRRVKMCMEIPDKPGALSVLMSKIGELKANMYDCIALSILQHYMYN